MALVIADYSSSLATIGAPGDSRITVASNAGFPTSIPPDHARVSIENPDTHEIVRRVVTAVNGNEYTLDAPLGSTFPAGSLVELRNDSATLTEFVDERAVQGGEGLTETAAKRLIKPYAQAGNTTAKVPFSDIESTANLNEADTRNFDSQRFVVSDGPGAVDGFLEGSDLRGELQGADVPENRKMPPGGTTGQALKKRSDTDYEVHWADDESGGGGVTDEQAADIESAKQFEVGLRQNVELAASQTIRQAASNAAERFTGGKALPSAEPDDELVWTVGANTRRIKAQELRDKTTASNGAQLSATNAVPWTPVDGGSTYYLALEAGGQLLFASGDVGDYTTAVTYSRIDVEPSSRQSSNELVPAAKIPAIDYNSLSNRPTIPAAVPEVRQVPAVTQSDAEKVLKVDDQGSPGFAIQTAEDVNVDAAGFNNILESTDTDMQRVAEEVDRHTHTAAQITVDTSTLGDHVPASADTVLKALKAINDLTITTSTTGLDRTAVEARIRALVAAWALTGNTALLPDGKLNPDLQLLIRNIVTGGWRADAAITVSQRIQGPAFTLATARTQTYRTEYDPPGPRQTNVNIAVRIARTLFDNIPSAADSSKVRVRLDSNAAVAPLLSTGTHLGSGPTDADDSFDYYNLPIPDLPADSIAKPELDAPTELTNISIPAESIVGRLPGASAGVRTLLDGNITGLSVQALNALQNGNATPFSPAFSIAADGSNANGIFEVSIRTSIGTSSDTLSFDNDETVTTRTVSGIVTASDLRAQAVFSRAGAVEGIRAARVPVYAVSGAVYTEVGHLNLYLVRDASNEVSYLFDYRPNGVHTESGNAAFGAHLIVAFQRQDQSSGGATTPAPRSVLSRESLTSAVTLADPTGNGIVDSAWVDIFSHTVTTAEGTRGFMHVGATVFATLALGTAGDATTSPDRGGDRPLLVIQLIKGSEELARNYRYFRFSGGIPLDCILSETVDVAANDVIKVRAQMSRLTAAGTALGAQVTTDSHWERFSTN